MLVAGPRPRRRKGLGGTDCPNVNTGLSLIGPLRVRCTSGGGPTGLSCGGGLTDRCIRCCASEGLREATGNVAEAGGEASRAKGPAADCMRETRVDADGEL